MISTNLLHYVNRFCDLNVLVIGDAMLDHYLRGPSDRLCREAPVPIVDVATEIATGGGAANTAINVESLGARVNFLSVVGDDGAGRQLKQSLQEHNIATHYLILQRSRRTLSKHRIVANGQLLVRFDRGTGTPISQRTEAELICHLDKLFVWSDAVIISDYGYGVLTPRVISKLAELQARAPRLLVVDAKRPELYRDVGVSAVKPNYGEAIRLLEIQAEADSAARVQQIQSYGDEILSRTGAQIAAVTLDHEGALILERDRPPYRTYAQPRPDSRAAGAGDTFTSTLTLSLAAGAHTPAAAEIASGAAAIVVAKDGTTACSATELRGYLHADEKFVTDHQALKEQLLFHRHQEKRIVFTNGCFDILHRGHITYLNQAKAQGDILIVGLNSDDSVRRLKGDSRPINCLEDRAQVLSAMSCVDYVVPFSEDTPLRLIELVRPDIFVKGGDYTRDDLPEAPLVEGLGGAVRLLPYLDDFSTSGIIERIRESDGRRPSEWSPTADGHQNGHGRGSAVNGRGARPSAADGTQSAPTGGERSVVGRQRPFKP